MNTDTFQLRENDLRCMVHINPEAELLAVESGNVSVILSGQAYTVGSGEAMLIFPYQLHGFSHKNAVKAKVYMFSQTVVEFFCKEYSSGLFEKQTFRMDPALFSYLEYALMHLDAPYADLTAKSMFYMPVPRHFWSKTHRALVWAKRTFRYSGLPNMFCRTSPKT